MSETLHTRPLEELCDELDALSEAAAEPYRPNIEWSAAVVGGADRIFPPAHMAAYWKELATPYPTCRTTLSVTGPQWKNC